MIGLLAERLRSVGDDDLPPEIEEGAPRRYDPTEHDVDPNNMVAWKKEIPSDCPFDADHPGDFERLGPVGKGTAWRCIICDQAFVLYPESMEWEK